MQNTSFLHKANLFIRSLLFSLCMWIITILQSFLCILTSPLPLSYRFASIVRYNRLILWLLKVICGVNYQIDGLENIPKDRVGVILSKHQSTWETFYLPIIFHEPAIIVKRELLFIPFFGWGMATISPIAINRNNKSSAMQQIIKKGKECLAAGRWILVFPEGTRIPAGKIGKYRLGGARLAVETDSPVIPVAHNAGRFWPRRKFIKQPGTVRMVIGPLIETKGRTPDQVLEQTKQWIEDTIEKIDGVRGTPL
ncbi:MAG: lysophospholipid acyltransferase family protein [Gammaproteobacteria bacterium]